MRLWSLHPKYLDVKGLVALWREGLLAKHVLEGKTKGYKNHPQLERFKNQPDPLQAIHYYLCLIHNEASRRNFRFDKDKVDWNCTAVQMSVTKGQLDFEVRHLRNKLQSRDPEQFQKFNELTKFDAHPMFILIDGKIETWERDANKIDWHS
jgi:hypothetical protein